MEKMSEVCFVVVVLFLHLIKNDWLLFLKKISTEMSGECIGFRQLRCAPFGDWMQTKPSLVHNDPWLPTGPFSSAHPFSECLGCACLGSGPASVTQSAKQSPCSWAIYIMPRCPIILNHPAYFIKCIVEVIVSLDHSFHEIISLFFSVLRIQLRILGKHSPNGLHPPPSDCLNQSPYVHPVSPELLQLRLAWNSWSPYLLWVLGLEACTTKFSSNIWLHPLPNY